MVDVAYQITYSIILPSYVSQTATYNAIIHYTEYAGVHRDTVLSADAKASVLWLKSTCAKQEQRN